MKGMTRMTLKCVFADLCVEMSFCHKYTKDMCAGYEAPDDRQADIIVAVTQEDIDRKKAEDTQSASFPDGVIEFLEIYRRICAVLPMFDAMLLHSAAVAVDGKAYLFSAVSGTGKTTHIMQWRKLLGDAVTVVNGDKPIIRKIDGVFCVCGTPWAGKENWQTPVNVPIAGICELTRSRDNHIERVAPSDILPLLLNQTYRPSDTDMMIKLLALLDGLMKSVPLYRLGCNISVEAARTSYDAMSEKKEKM